MSLEILGPSQVAAADYYQRRGYTFTEIARQLGVRREQVVQALYYDVVGVVKIGANDERVTRTA